MKTFTPSQFFLLSSNMDVSQYKDGTYDTQHP